MNPFEIRAAWDDQAKVWIATSDDIPGLCIQADAFDDLIEIATGLAPELLAENRVSTQATIPLHIVAERTTIARAA